MERVVVGSKGGPEGERFCIMRPDSMPIFPIGSVVDLPARMADSMRDIVWLTEDKVRADLAAWGLSAADIDRQFARARSMRTWLGELVMERTTTLGHRNAHGQQVVAGTDKPGSRPFERIFVLRCGRCGHEHEVEGSDIHARRCPRCPS